MSSNLLHRGSRKLNIWEQRARRSEQRGLRRFSAFIANRELAAAARLWKRTSGSSDGWTIDIGAGSGLFWNLVDKPANLVLIDIARYYKSSHEKYLQIVADARWLPIAAQSVTHIVSLGLLEYIEDLNTLLSRWRELTIMGGRLLITQSPPILANRVRQWGGWGAIPRSDQSVVMALSAAEWRLIEEPQHAGWQTLFIAEAV